MAQLFPNVLPGDLITADEMNRILQALNSLNDRVTALEGSSIGGSSVAITDLIPPSGTVKVGDPLTVIGRNFGFSVGSQRVYIDDLRIDAFNPGSSDTQLIFNIPLSIINVPQQGRPATLTVSNANSSAQRTLLLQSALVLTGSVDVIPQGVTPATIVAGQPVTFAFSLRSRANMDAKYALNATVNVATAQPTWQANLQILDANQVALPSGQIPVPAGQSVSFFVRISPVPPGTDGTPFSVQVDAGAGGITGSSGAVSQTVGSTADQPDTTIKSFGFSSAQIKPTPASGTVTASQIQLATGASAKISLDVTFSVQGNYVLTPSLLAGATNWQVQNLASTTPNPFPVSSADLSNPQGLAPKTLDFTVVRQAGATSGQIEFKIQRQGAAQTRKFTMTLTTI